LRLSDQDVPFGASCKDCDLSNPIGLTCVNSTVIHAPFESFVGSAEPSEAEQIQKSLMRQHA